jgi:beta-lactam-binding protein with PASTA domain
VRKALATLPWVEQGTVETDVSTREVRFNVKDKSAWSEDEVRKSLKDQRFPDVTVKTAPQ